MPEIFMVQWTNQLVWKSNLTRSLYARSGHGWSSTDLYAWLIQNTCHPSWPRFPNHGPHPRRSAYSRLKLITTHVWCGNWKKNPFYSKYDKCTWVTIKEVMQKTADLPNKQASNTIGSRTTIQENQPAAQIAARHTVFFLGWRHIYHESFYLFGAARIWSQVLSPGRRDS